MLTKEQITAALTRLGQLADEQNETIDLLIVGGAALVLALAGVIKMEQIQIEQVAGAALAGEALLTRHLALTFLRETENLSDVPAPTVTEPDVLAATAAFAELFAQRRGQPPPRWTAEIERQGEPIFLFRCKPESNTYRLCLETAPQPLRERGFYAPYNYLTFV